jgi:uncharacterized protein YlzI (FlbEa/FlbD family)
VILIFHDVGPERTPLFLEHRNIEWVKAAVPNGTAIQMATGEVYVAIEPVEEVSDEIYKAQQKEASL